MAEDQKSTEKEVQKLLRRDAHCGHDAQDDGGEKIRLTLPLRRDDVEE